MMRDLSEPVLLFLWAIAVLCAVLLWRYRTLTKTPRRASREQARQTDSPARTGAASASTRADGSIRGAPKGPGRSQAIPQAHVDPQRTAAPTPLALSDSSAAAELQRDDPWLGTVHGERMESADSAAALSEQLRSLLMADERINADENAAMVLPVVSSHNADRDDGRPKLPASPVAAVPPRADGSPAIESTTSVADMPGLGTRVIATAAAALTVAPIEAALQDAEPDTPLADGWDQQFALVPAADWNDADHIVNVAVAAKRETSAASQPLPDANLKQGPAVEPLLRVAAIGQELTFQQIEHDRQWSDHTADLVEQEPAAAAPVSAVEHLDQATHVYELAATVATAATLQPASTETAPPFVRSLAPAGFRAQPEPFRNEAAAQTVEELDAGALGGLPVARVDAPLPIIAAKVEAAVRALPPKSGTVVLLEQLAIVQADEATALDQQDGSAGDRVDDLQPSEDAAVQLPQAAPHADEAAGEEAGADLELEDPTALRRDALSGPARQAVHRDRRGRHPSQSRPGAGRKRAKGQSQALRPPAEARLRLVLHPIRRTAGLALILLRPTVFPERVTLKLNGLQTVDVLEEGQYEDVDLIWDADLLVNEIRVSSTDGYQWVRGARPVHIFAPDPAQANLVSVSAATAGTEHTIICRDQDAATVCDIAESAGSARPKPERRFSGVPHGWVVLSGYRPTRAAALRPAQAFSPLDPGHSLEISLQGGLEVGHRLYAQEKPPRIRIEPVLDGIAVRIGGAIAAVSGDGAWEAPGWDTPGHHRVEVVPGPSLSYGILPDPAMQDGWEFWDALGGRTADAPWSQARICGAKLSGPAGERVIATELQHSILVLGVDGTVAALRPRKEVGVSVGFAAGMPAFLLMSSGRRRHQGKIVWLGSPQFSEVVAQPCRLPEIWIESVRSAAARRLPVQEDEEGVGQSLWRKAVLLARSAKRQRHG